MPDFAELNLIIRSDQVEKADAAQRKLIESGKGAEDQAKRMTGANEALSGVYGRILGLIGKLTAAYASMKLVTTGLFEAAKFESLGIVFTRLTGNAEITKRLLTDIQSIADNSLLEFTPLANAAKRMLALGVAARDVVPMINSVGEAVSVMGNQSLEPILDAMSKMQAGMRVTTREMMALQQQGIPAWTMLARAIGETRDRTMELVDRGAIGGKRAVSAFLAEFQREYGGTMKMLDNSTEGLFSSLLDNVKLMLREMGTGMIEAFDARGTLQPMVNATQQWRGLLGDVARVLVGLNPQFEQTANLAERLAKLVKAMATFTAIFLSWEAGLKLCEAAMWGFNRAIQANPLLFLLATATASMIYFADRLVDAGHKNRDWGDDMIMIWEAIAKAIRGANNAIREFLDADRNKPNVVKPGEEGYNKAGWKYPLSWAMGLDLPVEGHVRAPDAVAGGMSDRDKLIQQLEQKQIELTQAAKRERDLRMGEGPGRGGMEEAEYLASMRQLRQMQEDLDLQLKTIGMTNNAREVEAARLKLSRLELKGVDEQTEHYIETLKKLQESRKLEDIANGIGDAFGQAFDDMILGAKTFGQAMQQLFRDIQRAVIQSVVTRPAASGISALLAKLMGVGGGGSNVGIEGMTETHGLPGGTPDNITGEFANGGVFDGPISFPMRGGHGIFGERGPEAIMPLTRDARGRLGVRGGGGGNVYVTIVTNDADSFRRSRQQVANDFMSMMNRRR
jgi:hypothetical protein